MSMQIRTNEENLPKKKLVPHTRAKDGIVTTTYTEIPVDLTLERIEGARAPIPQVEERVKTTPTRAGLRDHRLVEDPQLWGAFKEVGVPKIFGDQPRPRDLPAVSGRPIPTRSETATETSLLTRAINRLLGEKKK